MPLFNNPLRQSEYYKEIESAIERGLAIHISDIADEAKPYLISELAQGKGWKLIVSYDEGRARKLYEGISCFYKDTYLYPARDLLFFAADVRSQYISGKRIEVWKAIATQSGGIIVTTIDALMDKLENYNHFKQGIIELGAGDNLEVNQLLRNLAELGYERNYAVEGVGQFTMRGGIIDIYPSTETTPIRIELWDDEIDSMRSFDVSNQRSLDRVEHLVIYPAKEKLCGGSLSFLSYIDRDNSKIMLDESNRCYERAVEIEEEYKTGMVDRIEDGGDVGQGMPELFSVNEIYEYIDRLKPITMSSLEFSPKHIKVDASFAIVSRQIASYKEAWELLISDLRRYNKERRRVVLLTVSKTRARRLVESLKEYDIVAEYVETGIADVREGRILVVCGNLAGGFEFPRDNLIVLTEGDIFGTVKKKKAKRKKTDGNSISSLSEVNIGDYIVHEEHGLGIYLGIEKIEKDDAVRDYIKLEYAKGDCCYIPATKLDRIQKYASMAAKRPKLNRLGGAEWKKAKRRVKMAVEVVAKDLVELYAHRLNQKGHVYGGDDAWQEEFEEMFTHEETEDQLRAIEDTKADMEAGKIMDRLICGDVGYGKTEIALRAAFKTVTAGFQVLYLVPTTILAQQHYNTFVHRMKDFPVTVDLLCRFRTPSQQRKTIENFEQGRVDIIIGTHRILSKDIKPNKLGLVVIDEEQRFGVRHKEKLKQYRETVNVLTLTATPIPRTLHMSLVGIRDLSVLKESPIDRKPIQTYVCEYSNYVVKEAIHREIKRGGQVYYVYNRVHNIADVAAKVQELVPEAIVAYAHGQMPERKLEKLMLDFIYGDIDVLISTTIIETGLDIPNANTILIHDADRFGLSQLYQLRGRVGRSARTSYAFLLYKRGKLLTEEASKRLKAIKEFTELGSGIKIAMRDLEIRGAGNVLGEVQHGHMNAVGYDMYCKLLGMAIKEIGSNVKEEEEFETSIVIDVDAYIPESYVGIDDYKLDIYKRIASIKEYDDYLDIQDELIDRFGDMPESVDNLLKLAWIRALAHRIYAREVVINDNGIKIHIRTDAKLRVEAIPGIIEEFKGALNIKMAEEVSLIYKHPKHLNSRAYIQLAMDVILQISLKIAMK